MRGRANGKCVLVRPLEQEIATMAGVILPPTQSHYRVGELVSVGPKSGLELAEDGDIVYYNVGNHGSYEGLQPLIPHEVVCVAKKDGTLLPVDNNLLVWADDRLKDDEGGTKTLSYASWNNFNTSKTRAQVVGVPKNGGGRFEVGDFAHFSPQVMLASGNDAYVNGRRVWRLNTGAPYLTDVFAREKDGQLYAEFKLLLVELPDEKPESSLIIPENFGKKKAQHYGLCKYSYNPFFIGKEVVFESKSKSGTPTIFPHNFDGFGKLFVIEEKFVHGVN